jgi:hypothetical protein
VHPRSRAGAALLALTLTGGLAACGDDDADAASDSTDATTSTTSATPPVVEVTAVDYAFEGVPETLPAGGRLWLTNVSEVELHELIAFMVPADEERSPEELAALPEAELEGLFTGPPAAVLLAPPNDGAQINAVGDGTLTEPGRYVLFCAIPLGADPDAFLNAPPSDGPPEVEGGPPHFTEGMVGEITVD